MPEVELSQAVVGPTLLKHNQVQELVAEKQALERDMNNPNIRDPGVVTQQLRRVTKELANKTPMPAKGGELDYLVKREAELRSDFTEGMPTQEEMRRAPPGAVGKHMAWEKRNKPKIREWQNIKLRLAAGTQEAMDPDLTSVERHRPWGEARSMNMEGAQIQGKQFHFPDVIGIKNVMSDEDKAALNAQTEQVMTQIEQEKKPRVAMADRTPEERREILDERMKPEEKKSFYQRKARIPSTDSEPSVEGGAD